LAVGAKVADNGIVVEKLFTFGATSVVLIAAVIANVNAITVGVDSERNFIGEKIFVALVAKQVLLVKTVRANVGAVMNNGHLSLVEIFFAVLAEAIILVQAVVADVNTFAVAINDFPSFGTIIFTFLAELATVVVAIVTEKFGRNFISAGNAKSVGAYIENLVVLLMVSANRNFSVEVRVTPVRITAETIAASNMDAMFVVTIFFRLPEVRNALKLGNFTLNQIAIKL